jgi:hydroxyethylthiazole kinase
MANPGDHLEIMRAAAPLVHCVTNFVAMTPAANALLAAGASPAMVHAPEEAGAFAGVAGALTVNIGTIDAGWRAGMVAAAEGARAAGTPWVLDPVAVFISPFRLEAAARLMEEKPAVIRGNASEIMALAGEAAGGRGADAGDPVEAATGLAMALARRAGAVVAVTGAVDFVTDGETSARVEGGHPLMTRVTAMGCSLTAVIGAYIATSGATREDRFAATVAALAHFKLAGCRAAATAEGPGSFHATFLDRLAGIDGETLDAGARVTP